MMRPVLRASGQRLLARPMAQPPVSRTLASPSLVARRTLATAPGTPKKKSLLRRVLVPVLLVTTTFYAASVPLALYSPRYRDFIVEEIPFGEELSEYLDELELDSLLGKSPWPFGSSSSDSSNKPTANEVPSGMTEPTGKRTGVIASASHQDVEKRRSADDLARRASSDLAGAARAAVDKASKAVNEGELAAKKEASAAKSSTKEAVKEAGDAVKPKAPADQPTVPVYAQRPRDVNAQAPEKSKGPSKKKYEGPPLPVGFEPPSGYELPRGAPPPKGSIKPAEPPLPPLPLVAPSVKDVASSEPTLGELASVIDSLAQYASKSITEVGMSSAVSGVLNEAKADLGKLNERMRKIQADEKKKLEEQMSKQAAKYTDQLARQEKESLARIDTQESDWKKLFESERERLVSQYKDKLNTELETQKEIINQRLHEEVISQGIEIQRRWTDEIKLMVERERGGRLSKLKELEGGLRKLEQVAKDNTDTVNETVRAVKLWTAIKAVEHKVASGGAFTEELVALKGLATAAGDESLTPVIAAALESVPEDVASSGVASFAALAHRFTTSVAPQLEKASLLPEHSGAFAYANSAIMSRLLFKKQGWAEGDDVPSVVARAEFFLSKRDLDSAAREVNQLKGWPKRLARDWLEAARRHLEVTQALQVAEIESTAASLQAM